MAFDPFGGSGITLVTSVLEGRGAIGFEASEEYCEIAARRIETAQGGRCKTYRTNLKLCVTEYLIFISNTKPDISSKPSG
ncbi:site-specific DNA-methyltransferase [Gimesia maris]|uniref:site-specific DNA-methyltransferase n=1 Tax=Gimesia maris TaxID=122 RepID=UPI0021BC652E|nr:site-specific DNA-methyltransferase [Gimesia maris]